MFTTITEYVEKAMAGIGQIPESRKPILNQVVDFVQNQKAESLPVNLVFICTHNSRRSHFGQIWAATMADYFGLEGIRTYSGGTETTAFNPRAVAALERIGFQIDNPGGENPHYLVRFSDGAEALEAFSKVYDDATIPTDNKAAVMTCSEADANCPFVPGAKKRISLTYEDPKVADGTVEEQARYDERSLQIATEMAYVMQTLKG
ncbi:MAG TPA: protein-tyrosine-phosphatase [Cytophagales bacterium]|nr:protein-tyrosine-phosphatase [Cytophagales bacterium]HAA22527.1 protein-tyrosine-phosphatase [Cytophagales bacterium]HAP61397.1 protein-tyrosine-phosphatase [Cytophagales bacterium]